MPRTTLPIHEYFSIIWRQSQGNIIVVAAKVVVLLIFKIQMTLFDEISVHLQLYWFQ